MATLMEPPETREEDVLHRVS